MSTDRHTNTPPAPHLSKRRAYNRTGGRAAHETATKAREYYCLECGRRVTQSTDGTGEYGHATDCDHHFQFEFGAARPTGRKWRESP